MMFQRSLAIRCEIEGSQEGPVFKRAIHAVESFHVNFAVPPFDGHELLNPQKARILLSLALLKAHTPKDLQELFRKY